MHLYSLCQTWLNLKTHTVSETENRTSCLTTLVRQSQSVAVSRLEGGGGGQCRGTVMRWSWRASGCKDESIPTLFPNSSNVWITVPGLSKYGIRKLHTPCKQKLLGRHALTSCHAVTCIFSSLHNSTPYPVCDIVVVKNQFGYALTMLLQSIHNGLKMVVPNLRMT